MTGKINLCDYQYHLPEERIARYGLPQRDQARLLVYHRGRIDHHRFSQLPHILPASATLFFNNTKVISARLYFQRKTGALIEIFLLNPATAGTSIYDTLSAKGRVTYQCTIGNLKKWKDGEILQTQLTVKGHNLILQARLADRSARVVEFSWDKREITFGDILDHTGHTPLPPYLKRPDEPQDKERYQTVYSKEPGAVAAPTAGLHFTETTLQALRNRGITMQELTLHVSAGTFQPIKVDDVSKHPMHREEVIISKDNIRALMEAPYPVAVGTTAMRTLESLYWYGVLLHHKPGSRFHITKDLPYRLQEDNLPDLQQVCRLVLEEMQRQKVDKIQGTTEIFIYPGYQFQVCRGLVTNFHLPGSTLILLVAAFVGEDWRLIYESALQEGYRFLSFGDSSLLLT